VARKKSGEKKEWQEKSGEKKKVFCFSVFLVRFLLAVPKAQVPFFCFLLAESGVHTKRVGGKNVTRENQKPGELLPAKK